MGTRARRQRESASRFRESGRTDSHLALAAPPAGSKIPGAGIAWAFAGLATFLSFGFAIVKGTDTWWQLAAGRWAVEHRAFPLKDPFSFTRAGAPWNHHEWLSSVLFYAWTRIAGVPALVYVKWALVAATYLLLFRVLLRRGRSSFAAYFASAFAAALAAPFLDLRPHLFSLAGYVLVLGLALRQKELPWMTPLLFLVWANFHGGFLFGIAVLVLLVPLRAWFRVDAEGPPSRRRVLRHELSILALSAAAPLANPNGVGAFSYPLKYAFDPGSPFRQILEWLPPFRAGGIEAPLLIPAIALAAVSAAFGIAQLRRGGSECLPAAAGLVLSAATLAMSLESRRFIPLFGISESLLIALAIDRSRVFLGGFVPANVRRSRLIASGFVAPALAFAFGIWRLSAYPVSTRAFSHLVEEELFPGDAMDALETAGISGNVFAHYDWGGYVSFRSNGRLRVFIDGRADTVYDDATFRRYLAVINHEDGWLKTVEDSAADFVLWPRKDRVVPRGLLESGRWRLVHQDSTGNLLERAGGPIFRPTDSDSASRRELSAENAWARGNLGEAERQASIALAMNPEFSEPCHLLARIEASRGSIAAARAKEAECQKVFPQPRQQQAFEEYVQNLTR